MRDFSFFAFLLLVCACSTINEIPDSAFWVKLCEGGCINGYTLLNGKVYGGELNIFEKDSVCLEDILEPIPNADAETFEVCHIDVLSPTAYARDKHSVYYPREVEFIDGDWVGGSIFHKCKVPNARPVDFKYLGQGYGISGEHMFRDGEEIEWRESIIDDYLQKRGFPINPYHLFKDRHGVFVTANWDKQIEYVDTCGKKLLVRKDAVSYEGGPDALRRDIDASLSQHYNSNAVRLFFVLFDAVLNIREIRTAFYGGCFNGDIDACLADYCNAIRKNADKWRRSVGRQKHYLAIFPMTLK